MLLLERAINTPEVNELFNAIASLQTGSECRKFMRDLCSLAEIKTLASRWQVVKRIQKGVPYRNIARSTGASTATITRVAHWLHHGMGGYRLVLDRLKTIQHRKIA